jgi:hypothetical protein
MLRSSGSRGVRLLPPIPPAARFVLAGLVVGALVYTMSLVERLPPPAVPTDAPPKVIVPVPALDDTVLAGARDATREQRLLLEVEPLRHLLAKAIDVGPTVAAALGMPDVPIPVPEVRARMGELRRRWLWYEGVLDDLAGPREGHPIAGRSIYEATVRLTDGNRVLAAFSEPPPDSVRRGSWVRVEGFLMKLRDTTYPESIDSAPMLVGRAIQPDYEDWPAVPVLDPSKFDGLNDFTYFPGDTSFHTVDEDQTEALWHLAAFVRDTAHTRTKDDWRAVPPLTNDTHPALVEGAIARGTPMRVIGSLIQYETSAAPTNPAGIKAWTVAWVQVREYSGGAMVPVWVPKRVELPERAFVEVRGFYYRWFAYDTVKNQRRRVPLFVAADLDVYELEVDKTMRAIGTCLGGVVVLFLIGLLWSQHRSARQSEQHARDMDERRRRRRERARPVAATVPGVGMPPPLPPPTG